MFTPIRPLLPGGDGVRSDHRHFESRPQPITDQGTDSGMAQLLGYRRPCCSFGRRFVKGGLSGKTRSDTFDVLFYRFKCDAIACVDNYCRARLPKASTAVTFGCSYPVRGSKVGMRAGHESHAMSNVIAVVLDRYTSGRVWTQMICVTMATFLECGMSFGVHSPQEAHRRSN